MPLRRLAQFPPQPSDVTFVKTAQELQQAIAAGAADIEIQAHLDFRTLPLAKNPIYEGDHSLNNPVEFALVYAGSPLRSIRVCSFHAPCMAQRMLCLPHSHEPSLSGV